MGITHSPDIAQPNMENIFTNIAKILRQPMSTKMMMLAYYIMIGTAMFPKPWNCFAKIAWQWFYHQSSQMWVGSPRDWLARLLAYPTWPPTMDQEDKTYLGSLATHQHYGTTKFHRGSQLLLWHVPTESSYLSSSYCSYQHQTNIQLDSRMSTSLWENESSIGSWYPHWVFKF